MLSVDLSRPGTKIDQRIYGHLLEHMGYAIYGGIWDVKTNQAKADVLEKVGALKPPLIRYPGGCFADTYHWKDGIGPRDKRPTKKNKHWGHLGGEFGDKEPNYFGTDEFLIISEKLGSISYINVNFGSGTPEEAADWVEYVNGPITSAQGSQRAQNGHPAPYGVKLWGIGNEIYGFWETGYMNAAKYADGFLKFAAAMKKADPEIKLVAVGCMSEKFFCEEGWNKTVIKRAGAAIDYLSLHEYFPDPLHFIKPKGKDDYYSFVAAPLQIGEDLEKFAKDIKDAGAGKAIGIALDEWNLWWGYDQIVQAEFALRDALFTAGVLNLLQKKSPLVSIANYAQLINVLGLINTVKDKHFLSPSYFALQAYSNFAQPLSVPVAAETGTFSSKKLGTINARKGVPYLDASATVSTAKDKLVLFVINRHYSDAISARLDILGAEPRDNVSVHQVNGAHPEAKNDLGNPHAVSLKQGAPFKADKTIYCSFPAHSLTVLSVPIQQ